jgi:excinuclease UvrABC nuclease subunit
MSQGLYRWFDKDGHLLYVGISVAIHNRVKQHQRTAEWVTEASFMTVEWFDTRYEVERAEKKAIEMESPLHNKAFTTDSGEPRQVTPPDKSGQLRHVLQRLEMHKIQYDRQRILESAYKKDIDFWRDECIRMRKQPIERIFVA